VRALGLAEDGRSTQVDAVSPEIQAGDAVVLVTEHLHRSVDMAALGRGSLPRRTPCSRGDGDGLGHGQEPGRALGVVVVRTSTDGVARP